MKKLIAMIVGLLAAVVLAVPTPNMLKEVVNGVEWSYTITNGVAYIGAGTMFGTPAIPRNTKGEIVVPEKLGGAQVKSVPPWAFALNESMTAVVLPSCIASIDGGAFFGCENLRKVTIASSNTEPPTIDSAAFFGCKNLTEFVLPPDDLFYKTVDGALCNGTKDKLIVGVKNGKIPSGIEEIMYGAFAGRDITTAIIPTSVTRIERVAFAGCEELKVVSIPSSVTYIGAQAFTRCLKLWMFVVAKDNPKYKAENDCLCSKDGSELLFGVCGNVVVPPCVKHIVSGAFFQNAGLTSVTIPPSVMKIDKLAFNNCTALKTVFTAKGDSERVKGLYKWDEGIKFVEK